MKKNLNLPSSSSALIGSFVKQIEKLSELSMSSKDFKASNFVSKNIADIQSGSTPSAAKNMRFGKAEIQKNLSDDAISDLNNVNYADLSTKPPYLNKAEAVSGDESIDTNLKNELIASYSVIEPTENASTSDTSLDRQEDVIVAQAPYAIPTIIQTPSFINFWGIGSGLGAIALSANKGGSIGVPAVTPINTTTPIRASAISGVIAAGPIVGSSGLKVEAFDTKGVSLGSTITIGSDGTFTITLNTPYTGIVGIVVSDINGSGVNFVDEATNENISLGDNHLITIFNLPSGNPNVSVNINPITTEVANRLVRSVGGELGEVNEASLTKAISDFARDFKLKDLSQFNLLSDKPALLLNSDGTFNSHFNDYGLLLAVKAVLDANPIYQIKDALRALATNSFYHQHFMAALPLTDWGSVINEFTDRVFNLPKYVPPHDQLTATEFGAVQSFAAGDLNGDGIADWLFTFKGGDPRYLPGKAYAIYGNSNSIFDLSIPATGDSSASMFGIDPGLTGEINLPASSTHVGFLPIILGDTNGNGKGEVAFATQRTPPPPASIDDMGSPRNCVFLSEGTSSFLRVITTNDQFGPFEAGFTSITSGDINGDGFSDLFLGDSLSGYWSSPENTLHPKLYVMFGNSQLQGSVTAIEMSTNGYGLEISNSEQNSNIGFAQAVAYIGDSNGDGYGDIAISNSWAFDTSQQTQEEVFVVFGDPNLTNLDNLDVAQIKNGNVPGYVIYGDRKRPLLSVGMNLNGSNIAGDFNGDGLNDFIFEGQTYDHSDAKFYVVLGKQDTSPIWLDQLGNDHNINGFSIKLPQIALSNVINIDSDMARDIASNCGDINGDGLDDILITLAFNTSIQGDSTHKTSHFLAYVVFGKTDLNNIDLNNLGNSGYKLGEFSKTLPTDSNFYGNLTAPGDINGDGIADLILDDYYCDQGLLPTILLGSVDNPSLHQQNKFTYQGSPENDQIDLKTTNVSETLVGGAGNDVIFGNGGADVIYGGSGNDVIYLNKNNIDQLSLPISDSGRLAKVDGGGGIDTLSIDGTNITLDLTHIANNRLQSIEKFDLGSSNTLNVSWKDVQNLTSFNIYNDSSGWSGFNSSEVHYHQLVVDGENSNSINLFDGGWSKSSNVSLLGSNQNYDSYINSQHAVQLLIKTGMSIAIL